MRVYGHEVIQARAHPTPRRLIPLGMGACMLGALTGRPILDICLCQYGLLPAKVVTVMCMSLFQERMARVLSVGQV